MKPQLKEIQWPKWRMRRLLGVGANGLGLQESRDSIPTEEARVTRPISTEGMTR